MRIQTNIMTIPKSGKISTNFAIPESGGVSIFSPVVTSGQVFFQGAWDTTSAHFTRIQNPGGSGDLMFSAAAGSKSISLRDVGPFPFVRLETSVPQAAVRSFVAMTRY